MSQVSTSNTFSVLGSQEIGASYPPPGQKSPAADVSTAATTEPAAAAVAETPAAAPPAAAPPAAPTANQNEAAPATKRTLADSEATPQAGDGGHFEGEYITVVNKKARTSKSAPVAAIPSFKELQEKFQTKSNSLPTKSTNSTSHSASISAPQSPSAKVAPGMSYPQRMRPVRDELDAAAIEKRTLVVKLPRGQFYARTDLMHALYNKGFEPKQIEAMGPLNSNIEWHVTFTDKADSKEYLGLSLEPLMVAGMRGMVSALSSSVSTVRVHWAPYCLPQSVLTEQLARYGDVLGGEWEKSVTKGLEHMKTLVRVFTIKASPDILPDMLNMYHRGKKYPLLITVAGRKPLCLKCGLRGHVRKDCNTPLCRNCAQFGHSTGTCKANGSSYASALVGDKGGVNGREDNSVEDEIMEERKEALVRKEALEKLKQQQKEKENQEEKDNVKKGLVVKGLAKKDEVVQGQVEKDDVVKGVEVGKQVSGDVGKGQVDEEGAVKKQDSEAAKVVVVVQESQEEQAVVQESQEEQVAKEELVLKKNQDQKLQEDQEKEPKEDQKKVEDGEVDMESEEQVAESVAETDMELEKEGSGESEEDDEFLDVPGHDEFSSKLWSGEEVGDTGLGTHMSLGEAAAVGLFGSGDMDGYGGQESRADRARTLSGGSSGSNNSTLTF